MRHIRTISIAIIIGVIGLCSMYVITHYNITGQSMLRINSHIWYARYLIGTLILAYPLGISSGKGEKYILRLLIISHVVIVGMFFATDMLGIIYPTALSIILLLVALVATLTINHRARIFLIVPLSILFFATTIVSVLPNYSTIPSYQDFYDTFGINLYIVVKDIPMTLRDISADITIQSAYTGQQLTIDIDQTSEGFRTYPIRKPTIIVFNSSEPLYNTFAFVQFYDGTILPIPSQSSLSIDYTTTGYTTEGTGLAEKQILQDAQGFITTESEKLTKIYDDQQTEFFIDRVGGPRTQNKYVDYVVYHVLSTLSQISPSYYAQNYTNYVQFKSMVGPVNKANRDELFSTDTNISIRESILPGIQRSRMFGGFFK